MLGFMMKDFLYFRRNTRLFALMVVLYLVFGFSMSNVAAISGMLSMLGLIVVLNALRRMRPPIGMNTACRCR